ncbi:MAG: hypothetical protein R3251_00185 [Candidatus Spechtbacterales bacterium]|nr:hypothetical protein [Candidatus Spechtbacterales bacterium]
MNKFREQDGITLYMALLMLSVIVSIALGISSLMLRELYTVKDIGSFVVDIYAADAGVERTLYKIRQTPDFGSCQSTSDCIVTSQDMGVASFINNAQYRTTTLDGGVLWCTGTFKCIRSLGSLFDTSRAFELSF